MNTIEKNNIGDLLKYEGQNLYSREEILVEKGQKLECGTIVGRVAETELIKQLNPDALDGTNIAIGILLKDVDATQNDTKSVMIVREAIVAKSAVIWPKDIAIEKKKEAVLDLYNHGIVIRKEA